MTGVALVIYLFLHMWVIGSVNAGPGVFDARFASNRAAELLDSSRTGTPILLKDARYPVTLSVALTGNGTSPGVDVINALTGEVLGTNVGASGPFVLRDPSVTSISLGMSAPDDAPKSFALHQNFPNPFNPVTAIGFDLPAAARVNLKVFNVLGQLVATLVNAGDFAPGTHRLEFRGDGLGSGMYFYRLEAFDGGGTRIATKKMLLLK